MRTPEDVLRSLKKYTWQMLGEPWEVRLIGDEGTFKRPLARVSSAGSTDFEVRTSKFVAQVTQAFAVYYYPLPGDNVEESRLNVARAEELVYQGFRVGVGDGAAFRVPLWDYVGVDLNQGVLGRFPNDYAKITSLSIADPVKDPTSDLLWTVPVNIRLTWARAATPVPGGRPVTAVRARQDLTGRVP